MIIKDIKKFLKSKGGILAVLGVLGTILIAFFFIILGTIYSSYNGDWSIVPQLLTSDFAIVVYVFLGLTIFALFYVIVIQDRKREIK